MWRHTEAGLGAREHTLKVTFMVDRGSCSWTAAVRARGWQVGALDVSDPRVGWGLKEAKAQR